MAEFIWLKCYLIHKLFWSYVARAFQFQIVLRVLREYLFSLSAYVDRWIIFCWIYFLTT